jgi:hypothetical protein
MVELDSMLEELYLSTRPKVAIALPYSESSTLFIAGM